MVHENAAVARRSPEIEGQAYVGSNYGITPKSRTPTWLVAAQIGSSATPKSGSTMILTVQRSICGMAI